MFYKQEQNYWTCSVRLYPEIEDVLEINEAKTKLDHIRDYA